MSGVVIVLELQVSGHTAVLVAEDALDLAMHHVFPPIVSRITVLRRPLLIVDMSGVTFMDSTGAGFLIALAHHQRKWCGAIALRGAHDRDLFVLEVCGALDLFRIDNDSALTK